MINGLPDSKKVTYYGTDLATPETEWAAFPVLGLGHNPGAVIRDQDFVFINTYAGFHVAVKRSPEASSSNNGHGVSEGPLPSESKLKESDQ